MKIAINGFGRIGMIVAKRILDGHPSLEIVAINDLASQEEIERSFSNDLVYGPYQKKLGAVFFQERDPALLPWQKMGLELVLECSGFFTDFEGAKKHLTAGAKKVIISAPSKSQEMPTYLLGVNDDEYKNEEIISMGSCTTNAVAGVAKVLDKHFGIKSGFINTVHSYTNTQNKIFPNWRNDPVAKLSIIPSTTGATKTVEKVLPKLKGRLNGLSLRVPTETVSIVEFVIQAKKKTSPEKVNQALEKASQAEDLKNILKVETKKLISNDLKASPYSAIVDANLTQVLGDLIRVFIWYDNEFGYCCRLAEMAEHISC